MPKSGFLSRQFPGWDDEHPTALLVLLMAMPAVMVVAFWLGGQTALLTLALGLPVGMLAARLITATRSDRLVPRDSVTGLMLRHGFEVVLRDVFARTENGDLRSACFMIEIDDMRELQNRHGQAATDAMMRMVADRIVSVLRDKDTVARMGDGRYAVCLEPVQQLDLELCIQAAQRVQTALEHPIQLDGLTLYMTASVGFCMRNRAPDGQEDVWLEAAATALEETLQSGPGMIRAFAPDMKQRRDARASLSRDAIVALENGEIVPWFQPQLCTDTGRVSGFEALARWVHPTRGAIAPADFLPVFEAHGHMDRLSQAILRQSLIALHGWEQASHRIPRVAINLSQQDLSDPGLCRRLSLELANADVGADRLCIEILETVVSDAPDDIIVRNINELSEMGCQIDLDDYGTGHASIAALKRFPIGRIKIDRSFVMKSDQDAGQQRMIAALLSMAERLDIETLAEGVETVGEHAFLSQIGCNHVQGFGIGRPMPFDDTLDWLTRHKAKLAQAPSIGPRQG